MPRNYTPRVALLCDYCDAPLSRMPSAVRAKNYCNTPHRALGMRITESPIDNGDGTSLIPICRRDGSVRAYAIVDTTDAAWASQWRWSIDSSGYAKRQAWEDGKPYTVRMHRDILGLPLHDKREGDHANHRRLDNRRSNLREMPAEGRPNAQHRLNNRGSSSQYRNVYWRSSRQRWVVAITMTDGRVKTFGSFHDEHEAGRLAQSIRLKLMPYALD